jgi:putative holliday junction resolvase
MRYLGIDYGGKRTGVALSDDKGTIAFPHSVLATGRNLAVELQTLAQKEGATVFVIGRSIDGKGIDNPVMPRVRALAEELKAYGEVVFEDERYSSLHASRMGEENAMHDASAAAIILQSYLDRKNPKPKTLDPYALPSEG